jgi:preprotein translocase subunit SecD
MKNIFPLLVIVLLSLVAVAHAASTPSVLQFRLVMDSPTADSEPMTVVQPNNSSRQPEVLNVQKEVLLDQSDVKNATVYRGGKTGGQTVVYINFTDDGAKRFSEATGQNIGRRLAVVIDGKLCMAPRINSAISGGVAQISGVFTEKEAENLVARINVSPAGEKPPVSVSAVHATPLLMLVMFGVLGVLVWMWTRRKGTPPAV